MQRLEQWLSGYRLPDRGDPLYEVEAAHLDLLRGFYALLCVTGDAPDPITAVRAHLSDFPDFPLTGSPTDPLLVLGVARPGGAVVDLKNRLLAQLTPEQAAEYLVLSNA
ncbi:MAG: hypothetical protein KF760_19860 [Candidatus Eremiobacteraeota bacterium]|nr:hypothetical protein [Candidatus Eremiobacteraeota bacterium]MCW5868036.1 hypothetical protein [Candidatus Eremiobacteraeota bacterium]